MPGYQPEREADQRTQGIGDYPKRNHAPNSGPIPLTLGRVWLYCSGEYILPPSAAAKVIHFCETHRRHIVFLQPL